MADKITTSIIKTGPIDCACVIHGDAYDWIYVERLYNMLSRHISLGIKLHVYTEPDRSVPAPLIKHNLIDWGLAGPKHGWWYKMQLFNTVHHSGPLLYFDLDTVIVKNIDWIIGSPLQNFWTVRDFKYLWRPTHCGINSSVMWWDTRDYYHVWKNFENQNLKNLIQQYRGDQDYLNQVIESKKLRFFPADCMQSWRWQCVNGGYDFKQRIYQRPDSGTLVNPNTSVLIFHGKPKPDQIADPYVIDHWQ